MRKAAERGEYRVLYVTEYIASGYGKQLLLSLYQANRLLLVAVDEAHCVEQWPESDFRKSYAELGKLRQELSGVPFAALSAVPTPRMWRAIRKSLKIDENALVVNSGIRRENLTLKVSTRLKNSDKKSLRPIIDAMIEELNADGKVKPTIIYAHKVREVRDLAKMVDELLNKDDENHYRSG